MRTATRFSALFASVFLLLIGHGLQLAILPIRASGLDWSAAEIGFTGSAYFFGFLLGCIVTPLFVGRVGHIRVFSATTTLCGVAVLLISISETLWVWSLLRLLTGFAISGCYVIIESWLNDQSTDKNRGRVLATYTTIVLLGMALGQYGITFGSPLSIEIMVIAGILLSTSIIPITLTPVDQPAIPNRAQFQFRSVARVAPTAIGCVFLAGMVTGALYTLIPLVTERLDLSVGDTAQVLVAMVLGGAAGQFPSGRLSDRVDRRFVLVGLLGFGAATSLATAFLGTSFVGILVGFFLIGAATASLYPVCLAHANDRMPGQFIQVGTVVLFVNAMGSILGPVGIALMLDVAGAKGFYLVVASVLALAMFWALVGIVRKSSADTDELFINTTKSTPAALVLDPRSH